MACYVRPMHKVDVAPVTEIDREAFPTQLPSPNYHRELQNRLSHYIVACDEEKIIDNPGAEAPAEREAEGLIPRLKRLFGRHLFFNNEIPPPCGHYIIGFTGLWVLAEEAHITTIAVREAYRRRGLGELLLIAGIDLAAELKAAVVTLEVRASNTTAQNLYTKYGFTEVGIRKGYYLDNREDAILMTTRDITLTPFKNQFEQLKQDYYRRWGIAPDYAIR